MKKLILVFVIITLIHQSSLAQLSNFSLGIRYGVELEHYKKNILTDFGQIITTNKTEQNNNLGFSLNYTLKKRIVFETGMIWIKRNYEQVRIFDAHSLSSSIPENLLFSSKRYSYKFIEIPLSTKVFLSKKDKLIKPFVELGIRANYLTKAVYTSEIISDINFTDNKNAYWGLLSYSGIGVNFFWKKFIFEANMNYRFYQKFKGDKIIYQTQYLNFKENNKHAYNLSCVIYRNLDFRKYKNAPSVNQVK